MAQIVPFLPRRAASLNRVLKGRELTRAALAADLGISRRTLLRYEKKGMPVNRRGWIATYDPALVFPWLAANSWVPIPPDRLPPQPGGDAV